MSRSDDAAFRVDSGRERTRRNRRRKESSHARSRYRYFGPPEVISWCRGTRRCRALMLKGCSARCKPVFPKRGGMESSVFRMKNSTQLRWCRVTLAQLGVVQITAPCCGRRMLPQDAMHSGGGIAAAYGRLVFSQSSRKERTNGEFCGVRLTC